MIDFDIARAWHKIFALHIEFVIDGIQKTSLDPNVVRDDAACNLGKWIFGSGARYARIPEYADLVEAHIRFHYAASAILEEHLAGRTGIRSNSFRAASEAVLASIDVLASTTVKTPPSTAREIAAKRKNAGDQPLWQETMRIGMKLIDEQHEELLNWIGKLNHDPAAAITSKSFVDSISAVKRLQTLHFETEEIFMQRLGLPHEQVQEHVNAHGELLKQLARIELDADNGVRQTAAEAHRAIEDQVLSHIAKYDLPLGRYIASPH